MLKHGNVHEEESLALGRVAWVDLVIFFAEPFNLIGFDAIPSANFKAIAIASIEEPYPEDNVFPFLIVNWEHIVESV